MRAPALASKKDCTGCGACAASCSIGAIDMHVENDGHIYPIIDASICVGCLQCEKTCPIQNSYCYGNNSALSSPFKAWNKDLNQRLKSSSGGVFAALAHAFVEDGGYVSGAIIDGLKVLHIVTQKIEDISRMQGSKYLQSDTSFAYKQIMDLLPNHRVLYSGTGCQVAGLLCLVKKKDPSLINNLFCIDIVCDGVPSYKLLEKTIESLHSKDVSLVSFRNKTKGWVRTPKELTLRIDGKETNLGEHNLMISGFNKSLTSRYSCYDCRFAYSDRKSDITLADFWGLDDENEDNLHYGVSLVVVHSPKGQEMLNGTHLAFSPVDWGTATRKNFRLYQGEKYYLANFWPRRYMEFILNSLSYKNLLMIYGVSPKSRYDIIGRVIHFWYRRKMNRMTRVLSQKRLF